MQNWALHTQKMLGIKPQKSARFIDNLVSGVNGTTNDDLKRREAVSRLLNETSDSGISDTENLFLVTPLRKQ